MRGPRRGQCGCALSRLRRATAPAETSVSVDAVTDRPIFSVATRKRRDRKNGSITLFIRSRRRQTPGTTKLSRRTALYKVRKAPLQVLREAHAAELPARLGW